jgi:hypothetical protein
MRRFVPKRVVAALIAGVTITAAAASAQTGSRPPVTISRCSGGITSLELVEVASYDVTVRNTSPVTADRIGLSARYGRHEKRATFDLIGPFPPDADVSRHLRRTVNGGLFGYRSDQNDCFIDYVHFSDGKVWRRAP